MRAWTGSGALRDRQDLSQRATESQFDRYVSEGAEMLVRRCDRCRADCGDTYARVMVENGVKRLDEARFAVCIAQDICASCYGEVSLWMATSPIAAPDAIREPKP
jgi:hypothetical protein